LKQQNTALQRKGNRVGGARLKVVHQRLNEGFLVSETREQGQINIPGSANFPPMQDRHAADEAKAPAARRAEQLNLLRRLNDLDHGSGVS
jgi:hypothetical protein